MCCQACLWLLESRLVGLKACASSAVSHPVLADTGTIMPGGVGAGRVWQEGGCFWVKLGRVKQGGLEADGGGQEQKFCAPPKIV